MGKKRLENSDLVQVIPALILHRPTSQVPKTSWYQPYYLSSWDFLKKKSSKIVDCYSSYGKSQSIQSKDTHTHTNNHLLSSRDSII